MVQNQRQKYQQNNNLVILVYKNHLFLKQKVVSIHQLHLN